MADKLLTLLEMTKQAGADLGVGLVEENVTVAPELMQLGGDPLTGVTFKIKKRVSLPGASVAVFRNANEGSDAAASRFEQSTGACFFVDIPLIIDEQIVDSGIAEGLTRAEVLAQEANGAFAQAIVSCGDQFYRGTTADAKGFPGIKDSYDTTNCEVSATGSSSAATSAYLIWNHRQGVRWRWGNQQGLMTGEWTQQMVTDGNSKRYRAWVNNIKGWVGLQVGHSRSIVRIKLITTSSGKNLSDALVAEALSKMPINIRQDRANLRLLCNSVAALTLQKSRSATTVNSSTPLQFAPQPTESNGVPIILTDSIPNNE